MTDTTPADDRPGDASQPLSFTIFVVPALDTSTNLTLTGAGANGYTIGNDLADQQVNNLFDSDADTANASDRLYG